jgi:hypothetical protein
VKRIVAVRAERRVEKRRRRNERERSSVARARLLLGGQEARSLHH